MNDPERNEGVSKQAKELFDDSVDSLDAATLSRLNQGRQKALAELQRPTGLLHGGRWIPATAVAAAAVVTVIVMRGPQVDEAEALTAADFEMLLEEESFEMFEDLEFFAVLDAVATEANGDVG